MPITTVEHVVLFKVRNSTDSSQIDAMIARIRSLVHIDALSHLSAGRILRCRSDAADTGSSFTVLLHSRYRSKPDLDAYTVHPSHVAVAKENSKICEDVMAIDWIADLDGPISPQPGSAMRLELLKPRDRAAAAEIVKAIDEGRSSVPSAVQVSYGENFSPARAKGFEVGFISIFPGLDELDEIEGNEEIKAQEEKMKPLLESSIVIDFVIPSPDCSL